ncbi:MAG: hypothetical protein ACHQCE_06140 [Streptosporangiales bacterium]
MRDTFEFPEEQPGATRAAGLRRLSRLTWRATQLSAVTAVGLATLFARTAPAPTAVGDTPAAPAAKTSPPAPASSSPGKAHPRRVRATASASAQAAARPAPQAGAQVTAKASRQATAAPSKSATLAPPSTAPAVAPSTSSAPAPAPTVSSTSHGGG